MADEMQRRRQIAAAAFAIRRSELGLTQEDVAERADIVVKTVHNFEARRRWPNARTRTRLERAVEWEPGQIEHIASGHPARRVVTDRDRALLRRAIHDDDDFRRVIGVLEGTVIIIEPDGDECEDQLTL